MIIRRKKDVSDSHDHTIQVSNRALITLHSVRQMSDRALITLYSVRCLTEPWSHCTVLDRCLTESWSHYTSVRQMSDRVMITLYSVRQMSDRVMITLHSVRCPTEPWSHYTSVRCVWQTHNHKQTRSDRLTVTNKLCLTDSQSQTLSDRLTITNSPTLGHRFPLAHGDFDQASPWQQHQHQVMCKSYGTATDLQAERDDNKPIWDGTKLKQKIWHCINMWSK